MSEEDGNEMSLEMAASILKRPDALFESDVGEALDVYLKKGNKLDSVVDQLTENYIATPAMVNVMCEWMEALGEVSVSPVKPVKRGRGRQKKAVQKATNDDKKEANPGEEGSSGVIGVREKFYGRDEAISRVEETLSFMVVKHFNPDDADRIFAEDGGIGIDWLPALIQHKRWRQFLYELMEAYPQCLMLNFTMKLISDAGFQNEIRVNTAGQAHDIYCGVLLSTLDNVLKEQRNGCRTEGYEKAVQELIRVVCQAEHTYLYTQSILRHLSTKLRGRASVACVQISEELRESLEDKEYEAVTIRLGLLQTPDEQIPLSISQAMLSMMGKGELNPADVSLIYEQFIMPRPPPVELIRDPVLFDMLFDSLFHCEGPKVSVEHRDKYIYLLAYACSVSETVNKHGQRTQSRLELDTCRASIERVVSLLESSDDILNDISDLMSLSRSPVVANGLLYYARTFLMSEDRMGEPPSAYLVLLDHVANTHPHMIGTVFDICCELFDKVSSDPEVAEVIMQRQRTVIDRFVLLFYLGSVVPVFEKIREMYSNGELDASLVRYFCTEVLDMIAPPYSTDLISHLLPLVMDEDIFDRASHDRFPAATEFTKHCKPVAAAGAVDA